MKNAELIVLGLAGVAVYMIVKSQRPSGGPTDTGKRNITASDWVNEIFGSDQKPYSNGWRYFSDGTAIDPSGNYYKDGAMIWQAPKAGA